MAASDLSSAPLVLSPDCIQTILRQDTAVQAADYRMRIHYTGGDFLDAVMANWPLSIEMNYGGSGWFSYLLVLVETRDGLLANCPG